MIFLISWVIWAIAMFLIYNYLWREKPISIKFPRRILKYLIIPALIFSYTFLWHGPIQSLATHPTRQPNRNGSGGSQGTRQNIDVFSQANFRLTHDYFFGLITLPIYLGNISFRLVHKSFFIFIGVILLGFIIKDMISILRPKIIK